MMRRLAWHLVAGRREPGWRERLDEIEAVSRMTPEAYRERTGRVLAEHLRWAATTIPYFRERVGAEAVLERFPILTRKDLQEHFDALRDPSRPLKSLHVDASGGSTGAPVRVCLDDETRRSSFATEIHLLASWGLRPWCRRAYLWGDDREQRDVPWKERVARRLLPTLVLNAFGMDDERMAGFARRLEAFRPEMVQGYATALDLFSSFLLRTGTRVPRPAVVRSSAESLSSDARARIEEAFGCPVRDVYGSRESTHLAAQCAHGGFHVLGHGRVLELVDDDGRAVAAGTPGRVLVTDLSNRAFGLVRYENGDVAAWASDAEPCRCGLPYRRLSRVLGRTSDFFTLPTGERVHGEKFTHLFYGVAGVERFQVHQRTVDRVEVRTVGTAGDANLQPVLAAMRKVLGPGVSLTWERVDAIPTTRSGKHRFTRSDVPFLGPARSEADANPPIAGRGPGAIERGRA